MEGMFMRVGFLTLTLITAIFASAMPITFVQAQSRGQEGLSQEKKRALSKLGPEDVWGSTGDESRSRSAANPRQQQRKGSPTPTPAPASRQSTTSVTAQPAATQPPATSSQQPAVATPSATIPAPTLAAGIQQSPLSQEDSPGKIDSKWAAPTLIVMALIVSAALIFILTKLFEKIREGSSG